MKNLTLHPPNKNSENTKMSRIQAALGNAYLLKNNKNLIYIDEMPTNLSLRAVKGRALKGKKAVSKNVPSSKNYTVLAAAVIKLYIFFQEFLQLMWDFDVHSLKSKGYQFLFYIEYLLIF